MFGFQFVKTEVCAISNVHFNHDTLTGTCKLVSSTSPTTYVMIWSIQNYPIETTGMPGSPYSIKVSWSISTKSGSNDHGLNTISGQFVYSINSGTFPNFSELGIRYGEYFSIGTNLKSDNKTKVLVKLNESEPSYVYLFI